MVDNPPILPFARGARVKRMLIRSVDNQSRRNNYPSIGSRCEISNWNTSVHMPKFSRVPPEIQKPTMLILHRKSQGENITELIDNNTYNNTTQHKTQSNHAH
eukprot:TRINITY_DN20073_c0_g1_i1.p1 TRINITY_DN20073_c0_g1~~TRINITY_DN20073_c0_g1_i1.p1  ORF type:complete len:102 (-),score=8.65 TRINITY_DN20073_c0_g1_i1:772-1077(-)